MAFLARRNVGCYVAAATMAVKVLEQQQSRRPERRKFINLNDSLSIVAICQDKPQLYKRKHFIVKNSGNIHSEYTIEGEIGVGGFSHVAQGIHKRTGIKRAIKCIPKQDTSDSQFHDEVKALSHLDHPHIVKLVEYFEDGENFYLVEELCTGPDLISYLEGKVDNFGSTVASEKDISIIIRQCLKSIVGCHASGYIHRDIKLENFMITGEESLVKMIDFGLAARYRPSQKYTEHVGTFVYQAPEVVSADQGGSGYSKAIDIWSLGVVFFALLSGTFLIPDSEFKEGSKCFVKNSKDEWTKASIQSKNSDGTFTVLIKGRWKSYAEKVSETNMRHDEEEDVKSFLSDPEKVRSCLTSSRELESRGTSLDARNLLLRMLEHDPNKRITGAEALTHPFILKHYQAQLTGKQNVLEDSFSPDIIDRLRTFANMPQLRRIALCTMVHLSSAEPFFTKELARSHRMFRLIDLDGNGEIQYSELVKGLEDHNLRIPADLADIYHACDADGSGNLTLIEFAAALLPASAVSEQLCREVFMLLDRTYNGYLDAEDFELLCKSKKRKTSVDKEHEYEEIITEAEKTIPGKTLNGRLSFDDFCRLMRGETA